MVTAALKKKWKDARESKTRPTLDVRLAKSFRPGNLALRQIRYFLHTQATMLLIQKLPFLRVVRETAQDFKMDPCFTATAILALHHATEYFLIEVMEKANLAAIHHKRITIAPKDMYLVRAITHVVESCLMYIHTLFKIDMDMD